MYERGPVLGESRCYPRGLEPEDTSLLTVLMDGFEKNESMGGRFWRQLPLKDAGLASRKYLEFRDELMRWKGPPKLEDSGVGFQRADWGDIRMKQAGRGVMIWVRAAGVSSWWHRRETWAGDPMAEAWEWDSAPESK